MINISNFQKYHGIFLNQFQDILKLLINSYNNVLKNHNFKIGEYDEDILRNILVDYARRDKDD